MKAFVLAAGLGTRLKPLTNTLPKPLVRVKGVPLILYALALLKSQGIKDIVINLFHLGEQIAHTLKDGSALDLRIEYSREQPLLGTGGGIAKVLSKMSEQFLVINADVIVDCVVDDFVKVQNSVKGLSTLGLRAQDPKHTYGTLTHQHNRVTSILSATPPEGHARAHFTGVHLLRQEQLQNFLKRRSLPPHFCIVRQVYAPYLEANPMGLGAVLQKGVWRDCGTFADLQEIETSSLTLSYAEELDRMHNVLQKFNKLNP